MVCLWHGIIHLSDEGGWNPGAIHGVKVKFLDKFRAYDSFEDNISGRAAFFVNNKRYHSLFESSDPAMWAQGLQDKGYATDPKYAHKLISIMKSNGWIK